MKKYFFTDEKDIWGFSLPRSGNSNVKLEKHKSETVQKIIHEAFKLGWQIDYLPHLATPCIFIKTMHAFIHFFLTEEDAIRFRDNIMFGKNYPCCLNKC